MQTYSKEFKLKVVKEYLEGTNGGYLKLCKKYDIPDTRTIRGWVDKYKIYGDKAYCEMVMLSEDGNSKINVKEEIERLREENKKLKKKLEKLETKERSKTNV